MRNVLLLLGVVVSIALMAYAGRRNPSVFLLFLFAGWVALPFVAAAAAAARAELWGPRARAILDGAIAAATVGSLAVYGSVALGPPRPKMASFFLVTPAVCLLVVAGAFVASRMTRS